FAKALASTLALDGRATIEFPWVVNLVQQCQFDTIYHEHYSYLSVTALQELFATVGMRIYDVEHLPTHGGSLRIYVRHGVKYGIDVSVLSAIAVENQLRYGDFAERV